jgi:hypothetical protein
MSSKHREETMGPDKYDTKNWKYKQLKESERWKIEDRSILESRIEKRGNSRKDGKKQKAQ